MMQPIEPPDRGRGDPGADEEGKVVSMVGGKLLVDRVVDGEGPLMVEMTQMRSKHHRWVSEPAIQHHRSYANQIQPWLKVNGQKRDDHKFREHGLGLSTWIHSKACVPAKLG